MLLWSSRGGWLVMFICFHLLDESLEVVILYDIIPKEFIFLIIPCFSFLLCKFKLRRCYDLPKQGLSSNTNLYFDQ